MKRRDLFFASGAIFAGMRSRAQTRPAGTPFRIGLIPSGTEPTLSWLRAAMSATGWQEGREYIFVSTGAGYDATVADARRLVAEKVDLVWVNSTSHALALRQVTLDLPIVMWASGYPVEAGLAVSLARPGKNVTGITSYAGTGIWGKLLQLLCDARPGITKIAVAWGYVPPTFPREEIEPCYRELNQAAIALKLGLHVEEISSPAGVSAGLAAIAGSNPDALLITAGPGFFAERRRVMQFAISRRMPTAADWPWPLGDLRPLLSYAPNFELNIGQAASYVVRILGNRERPGDLPIQLPSKFELVLDRTTARAIGLTIPQELLLRADAVVD
jgi:putative tryptophan/tyrosine transport system substrate-binding protein